jgi:hypothetical protein
MPRPANLADCPSQPRGSVPWRPHLTTPSTNSNHAPSTDLVTAIESLFGRVLEDIANRNELYIDIVADSRAPTSGNGLR